MDGKKLDLGLTAYDELFMDDAGRTDLKQPKIRDVTLSEIDDFPDHPFKVKLDENMDQLVQSIRTNGLITPITLRQKEDGRFEIVSGHRRRKACEILGLETIKAEVKALTRDEAIILMVESNFQRSQILPSEKTFSYKMRLEAIKRLPGRRSKENLGPVVQNYSRDELGETAGESGRQISRYIRLTELIPQLLYLVDEGKIAMRPAVEISYLTKEEQKTLSDVIARADATPSHAQAILLRKYSTEGKLTTELMEVMLAEEKPNQKEKISFRTDKLRKYIPDSISYEKTEDYVIKALEHYHRHLERQKGVER